MPRAIAPRGARVCRERPLGRVCASALTSVMSGEDAIKLVLASKDEGNTHYKAKEYKEAIAAYSKGVKGLPDLDDEDETPVAVSPELLKAGAVLLCNRAAAYMGENKPIPALADAQRASGACAKEVTRPRPPAMSLSGQGCLCADFDPTNWKAHWRAGLSLMMMKPRLERSEQACDTRLSLGCTSVANPGPHAPAGGGGFRADAEVRILAGERARECRSGNRTCQVPSQGGAGCARHARHEQLRHRMRKHLPPRPLVCS